ncbi:MAG TPA: YncE family protein [Polyangia bacterium]
MRGALRETWSEQSTDHGGGAPEFPHSTEGREQPISAHQSSRVGLQEIFVLILSQTRGRQISMTGCAATHQRHPASARGPLSTGAMRAIALPGAPTSGGVILDYIAYDRAHRRVWVPAGNTGSVDVINVDSGEVTRIDGFMTSEMERRGHKRIVGPGSATVGDGVVFVGNRGDSTVCAIDAASLQRGACAKLDSMPDGLAYVGSTKEVWVTTPRDKSVTIVDASTPNAPFVKTKMTFDGEPEGFVVDDDRGVFYTNLEDKDRTLAIDIKSRHVAQTWLPACGENGPKGLALDRGRNFLIVACADRVKVLDAGHDGKELSSVVTGDGVDNIDYLEARHAVYAGAARAGKLTVAIVDAGGKLTSEAVIATATGARNAVVTDDGVPYLTDAPEGKILAVTPPRR